MQQIPFGYNSSFSPEDFSALEKDVMRDRPDSKLLEKLGMFVHTEFEELYFFPKFLQYFLWTAPVTKF
jgi:hypothetical protein